MIINSLLDEDLYKLSMLRVYFHSFSNIWAKYEFKCRNENVTFTHEQYTLINVNIDHLCTLRFTEQELRWIEHIYWMKEAKGFIEFLRMFKLNRDYIKVDLSDLGKLSIVAEGPIWIVSIFEIFVLAIVNEIYFSNKLIPGIEDVHPTVVALERLKESFSLIEKLNQEKKEDEQYFLFSDFGTRRRWSFNWMNKVIINCCDILPYNFTGTSNMFFAKKFSITPIGTMAHEFLCLGQALDDVTLAASQKHQLQVWANEYRGDLGIALSDTLGVDFFLKDFDKYFANLFTGVRHDSGDPFVWGDKIINHYKKLNIDPKTKMLVFSDSLDFPKAIEIHNYFKNKAKVSFGIGTSLTNNFGIEPLNIVFKMTEANGKPVAKLSDSPGKIMCNDEEYIKYLKTVVSKRLAL